jgi:hypothetical protein|nr:MAG TPA: hypothetical protein [Crassvirales sp.]
MWDNLSMAEKANIIMLGIKSGIVDLPTIRRGYNSFARGGYTKWKEKIQKHKGIIIDGDDTYDYRGFYDSNPDAAWEMLKESGTSHFPDRFKTASHPSFSDESQYSGRVSRHNPKGIQGGHWYNDHIYQMSEDQFSTDWDTDRTLDYFSQENESPVLYGPDGSTVLRSIQVTPQSSALNRSREATSPNTDFSNAQDMTGTQQFGANWLAEIPIIGTNPHTCLNTVTGFYDPKSTVASNANMVARPEDFGYREIPQTEAVPGDIIILSNSDNHPTHAVMFDSVSEEEGIHNGYHIEVGDTLVNYSNGGRNKGDYRLQGPLPRFNDPERAGGDFSGVHRYYRYTGKGRKKK